MQTVLRALLAALSMAGSCAAQTKIPPVAGTTLSGDKVSLPQDLGGRPVVLIVGFSQASREQATAWGKRLAAEGREGLALQYYEMPVLAAVPRLLRGLVVRKIADGLSEPAKSRFLPIYEHENEWRAVAGYRNAGDAYVLLVEDGGVIRWRFEGPVSDASDAELKQQLAASKAP